MTGDVNSAEQRGYRSRRPRTSQCMDVALAPLRLQGVRLLTTWTIGSGIPRNLSGVTSHAPLFSGKVGGKTKYFTPLSSASDDFGDTELCDVIKAMDANRVSPTGVRLGI